MYSKKLEQLIKLSIEDGVIDETENSVLIKCAKEEGVDIDELTLYVNSLVKKRQRELEADVTSKAQKYEKDKKEAIGNICPKCGKQIPPMSLKCPYCGCEIVSKDANSSVKDLLSKIDRINKEWFDVTRSKSGDPLGDMFVGAPIDEKEKQIRETISLYPVPNTKEDIIEFLSLAASNSKSKGGLLGTIPKRMMTYSLILGPLIALCAFNEWDAIFPLVYFGIPIAFGLIFFADRSTLRYNKKAQVWRTKFNQVLLKGRSMQGDPDFQKQIDYYENFLKGTGGSSKIIWIVIALFVIIILFLYWTEIKISLGLYKYF